MIPLPLYDYSQLFDKAIEIVKRVIDLAMQYIPGIIDWIVNFVRNLF